MHDLETFDLNRAWTDFIAKAKLFSNWPTLLPHQINKILDEMNISFYTSDSTFRLKATAPYAKVKYAVIDIWIKIDLIEKIKTSTGGVFYKINDFNGDKNDSANR